MILTLHNHLRNRIVSALAERYGLDAETLPAIVIEYPPNRQLGDLAITVAFELARVLRKAPRVIAQELADMVGDLSGVCRVAPTGTGYLNIFLDRAAFARTRMAADPPVPWTVRGPKTIVEHTAINPNKAAHIGHLRNAVLGDTLCRLLRYRGADVEVQNYIDDTGVQVADVVVGLRELEGKGLDDLRQLTDAPGFDGYCWDLYARVTKWFDADETRLSHRRAALRDLEHDTDPTAAMARLLTDRIVRCHLRTMARLGVEYDLLSWEGDILRLQFWTRAFEILTATGAMFLQPDGRLAGCWVMPIIDDAATGKSAAAGNPPDSAGADGSDEARAKVIVRSDGTVTYVGKDIAYQLWKFGLLGKDFHYRWFATQPSGRHLWTTSSIETPPSTERGPPPPFGLASAVYNVIDTRQSYLQQLLVQALTAMQHPREAERSIHFSYEMVALSRSTAHALGYTSSSQESKPFVEVSGRKGLGVKADDLLDKVTERADSEVETRHGDLSPEDRRQIAIIIATAAVRYFMIKFSRGKVIAFDIDEALSFEGETGPYLQYATVRARKILEKLRDRDGIETATLLESLVSTPADSLTSKAGDELWNLILEASRLDEVAEQAVRTLELAVLAKYAFGLAQRFNGFYHSSPVLVESDESVRRWRAAGVSYFQSQMTRALELMGCEVPERM